MKKLISILLLFALVGTAQAQRYPYFGPANGILKGQTTTYQTTAAVASDIMALLNPTVHGVLIGEGTGPLLSLAMSADTLLQGTGADPQTVTLPDCAIALTYSTSTHSFGCAAGGSGTINSGTTSQIAVYLTGGTTLSGSANASLTSAGVLTLGGILVLNGGVAEQKNATVGTAVHSIFGSVATGGSGSTTLPYVYYNLGGIGPSDWSVNGAYIGFNTASGYTGNIYDVHINGGLSTASLSAAGISTVTGCSGCTKSVGAPFTISSCGTPTAAGGPAAGSFTAGSTSCNPVITLSAAAHGWHCRADDETTNITFRQTAHSTTTATLTASGAVTTSDSILVDCSGF
jgi:hypothetical protein